MKKILIYSIITVIILITGIGIYHLLFGKLLPYSPIVMGFDKTEMPKTIFYVQKGTEFHEYAKIDSLLPGVEDFHELQFKKKPKIFIFRDKKCYARYSASKARFCAFYNSSIVIAPWALNEARADEISLEIYLNHELSHSLLYQHTGLIGGIQYPHWLLEGIAMYSANQMGTSWYPSKEETYQLIREGNFLPPQFYKTRQEQENRLDVENKIVFLYSEFACIVDYLVEQYGRDKFLFYMKALINNNQHDEVFESTFGVPFDECIQNFKRSIQDK